MKSKKIERLKGKIRNNIAEIETSSAERCNELFRENEKLLKEIERTFKRNMHARDRHQAYLDCGLVRVKSATGKVYYE
jgi:hypothetical protein